MDDEIAAYVDKMFARAAEILKEDKILKHLRDAAGTVPEPPADPGKPPAPKVKPAADPAPVKHWWFGEQSGE